MVPLSGPVKELALEATRGLTADSEKARAIYDKVTGMMRYDKSGTGWGRGDAIFACDAKRGNCTDFHALIIGMARSVGIPARFAIGLPLPETRGAGEITGYHCWAELYVRKRGWVPVDGSEAAKTPSKRDYFFGHHDENRLELSRGRHLILEPAQHGAPSTSSFTHTPRSTVSLTRPSTASSYSPIGLAAKPILNSRQGCQRNDERIGRLESPDQSVIGRHQLTSLPLGQRDVEAIVDADAGLGGDGIGSPQKWDVGIEPRLAGQDVCQERGSLSLRFDPSPLRSSQGMGDFDREDIGARSS